MTRYQIPIDGNGQGFAAVQIQKKGVIVEVQHAYGISEDTANSAMQIGIIVQRANQPLTGVNGPITQIVDLGPLASRVTGATLPAAVTPGNAHNATSFAVELGDIIYLSTTSDGTDLAGLVHLIVRD